FVPARLPTPPPSLRQPRLSLLPLVRPARVRSPGRVKSDRQAQVSVGMAQSAWSRPLPSPPSPTSRSSTWPPVTGTSIVAAGGLVALHHGCRGERLAVQVHGERDGAVVAGLGVDTDRGGEAAALAGQVHLHVANGVGAKALGVGGAGDGDRLAVAGGGLAVA